VTPPNRAPVYALLATGGTGGHVYPALALAGVLSGRGHDPSTIRFVGGRRGLEGRIVAAAGYEIDLLPGRGLRRALSPANLVALGEAVAALIAAVRLVRRLRPRVVVGFGGYASLPAVVAARVLRVPTVVHEQNAAPGLANRVGARLGAAAAVSLPGTPLRGARVTGNPVRPEILLVTRAPQDPPLVAVVGGSLGARTLNAAALDLYDVWRDRAGVAVRHVSGVRDHGECLRRLGAIRRSSDALDYRLVEYEDDMAALYGRASAMVTRAGASTVAELAAMGVPAVLVPLPGSPGSHQERNAAALAERGAAVVVPDAECDGARLAAELEALLGDPARLDSMSAAASTVGARDAADRLADLVEERAGSGD
jgi:UDP-N-acetylglucosamine--N-acetylmuramyl-(pentapeptide) pyrophosphoryl-undecaprenol N-acetylglucosamine transferase